MPGAGRMPPDINAITPYHSDIPLERVCVLILRLL